MAYSILNEQPMSLVELKPDAPAELERIVKKLLRKDPLQRYQTAEEVIGDLEPLRRPGSGSGSGSGSGKAGSRGAKPREALRSGARLGPYEIAEPLGSGGMGDVYRARDTRLDRQVAIKVLAPEFSEDAERKQRFQREAKTISSLSHPNICTLFDVGEQEGTDYLVMEYLEGETLADRLTKGALPLNDVLKIGAQIGEALGAAHRQGVIHRDLKPGNVILTKSGAVKLVDFGLAKDIGAVTSAPRRSSTPDKPLTAEGAIVGTLAYMAPEQVEGREADARTDIFAFGAILYEMATGRRAFEGATKASLIAAILDREPPALAEARAGSQPASGSRRGLVTIEHIVRRCLAKEPDRRWQSAFDVANELRWVAERGDDDAEAPGRVRMSIGRRALMFGAGALIVACAVGLAFWLGGRASSSASPDSAVAEPVPKLSRVTWGPGSEESPSISPDGTSFVYVVRDSGNADIYYRRIGGETAINLTKDSPSNDYLPSISPDGQSIAFRSERDGGGIFIMGTTGESVRRLTDFGGWPRWSPDGRSIAFHVGIDVAGREAGIWIADVATGAPRKLLGGDVLEPTWSPSGKRIAFLRREANRWALATVPSAGGAPTDVMTLNSTMVPQPFWTREWIWYADGEASQANVWRVRVDEETGAKIGGAESVTVSTTWCRLPSVSLDGRRLLFGAVQVTSEFRSHSLESDGSFEPAKARTVLVDPRNLQGLWPSPDGSWLATVNFEVQPHLSDVLLVRAGTGQTLRLTNDANLEEPFAWTPDGARLLLTRVVDGRNEIWWIRTDGSGLERVASGGDGVDLTGVAISGDGRWLYVNSGPDRRPGVIDLSLPRARWAPVELPAMPDGSMFELADASIDGRWLAGYRREGKGKTNTALHLFDVSRKEYLKLADLDATYVCNWLPDSRRLLLWKALPQSIDQVKAIDRESKRLTTIAPFELGWGTLAMSRDGRSLFAWTTRVETDVWMLDYGAPK